MRSASHIPQHYSRLENVVFWKVLKFNTNIGKLHFWINSLKRLDHPVVTSLALPEGQPRP